MNPVEKKAQYLVESLISEGDIYIVNSADDIPKKVMAEKPKIVDSSTGFVQQAGGKSWKFSIERDASGNIVNINAEESE